MVLDPRFLTNFGNLAVALPVACVAVLWLWQRRRTDLAMIYGLNVALALAAAVVLKVLSREAGGVLTDTDYPLSDAAPSGHMTAAVAIYGGIAVLFAVSSRGLTPVFAGLLAFILIACVGVTRVTLGAHTPADVLAGLLTGGVFVLLIGFAARRGPQVRGLGLLLFLLIVIAELMQLTGLHLESTGFI